jgi:hypothetical protein
MLSSICEIVLNSVAILVLFIIMFAITVIILRNVLKVPLRDVATFEVFASGIFTLVTSMITAVSPRSNRHLVEIFIEKLRSYTTKRHLRDPRQQILDIGMTTIFLVAQFLAFWLLFTLPTLRQNSTVQAYRSVINSVIVQPLFSTTLCAGTDQPSTMAGRDWNTLTLRTSSANYFCVLVARRGSAFPTDNPSAWKQVIPANTYNAFDGTSNEPGLRNIIDVMPRRGSAIVEQQNGAARLVLNLYDQQFYVRYGNLASIQELTLATPNGERNTIQLQNTPGHFIVDQISLQPYSEEYLMPADLCIGE